MKNTIWLIVFVLLLIDSLGANAVAWFGERWYQKHFRSMSRMLPLTKAWAGAYLVLVIIIGVALYW